MATPLKVGETAPDFSATGSDGRNYRLHDILPDSNVLLIFYPGNDTPG